MGWEYVIPGYVITGLTLGGYALAVVRRGRRLSRQVPEDRRRFL